MHSRWLKTRRHFYESLRQEIQIFTGPMDKDILTYQAEYEKTFSQVWDVSSMEVLLERLLNSKIIIGGDFHYFYQSQRTHFKILKELLKNLNKKQNPNSNVTPNLDSNPTSDLDSNSFTRVPKLFLYLEMFNFKDQKFIDLYLKSNISFEDLLKKTKWTKIWGRLPIEGYEKILNWAKTHDIQIFGVNNTKLNSLSERDRFSAEILDQSFTLRPDDIHYVIYGDFHLAQSHLPDKIKNFNSNRDTVVHLNSDTLYFALSEHAIEDQFDVLNLGHEFCVLSSPPWVKLQSYLVFLQELDDDMISEVDDEDFFEPDYTDYLGKILDTYAQDFDLPDWKNLLDVLIPKDLDFEKLDFLKLKKQDQQKLSYFVTAQKNIVFPKDQIQFLAKPSVNAAYGLVGEFIHSQLSQRQSLNWSDEFFMPKRIWLEAVSFFFTLWLNPTISVVGESDLNNRLKSLEKEGDIDKSFLKVGDYAESVLRYAVEYRLIELNQIHLHSKISKEQAQNEYSQKVLLNVSPESNGVKINKNIKLSNDSWNVKLESASILGKIMGQKIYKHFKTGLISRDNLIGYFSVPLESDKFIFMYNHLLFQLG